MRRTKILLLAMVPWLIFKLRRKGFNYQKNILIIAVGRGGSTWLMELLSSNFVIGLFEPFSDLIKSNKFDKPLFYSSNTDKDIIIKCIRNRLRGKSLPIKSFIGVTIIQSLFAKQIVFKTVNMHFLGKELIAEHSVISYTRPLILFRHPFPIIMSELNLKKMNSVYEPKHEYLRKLRLSNSHPLFVYKDLFDICHYAFEIRFVELLVRYKFIIDSFNNKVWYLDYTSLKIDPKEFLSRVADEYTIKIKWSKIDKRSRSSLKRTKIEWQDEFSESQLLNFKNIINKIGLDCMISTRSEVMFGVLNT